MPKHRYGLEGVVATVIFAVLIVVVTLQIVGRVNLFSPPVWTEELSRWLWVWMALVAVAEVERQDGQLKAGFLVYRLHKRVQAVIFTTIDLLWLAAVGQLAWYGYQGVLRTWGNTAVTLPVTDAVLYASFPVAAVFVLYRIVRRIAGLGVRQTEDSVLEHEDFA
jgi:TRAP-type C4-dicarboxylate transport system permease small subunit